VSRECIFPSSLLSVTPGLETYVPPAPPLFPKLPHDLFYPFNLGPGATNGARAAAAASPMVAMAVAVVAAVGVAVGALGWRQ
jgi:hypothetical protein